MSSVATSPTTSHPLTSLSIPRILRRLSSRTAWTSLSLLSRSFQNSTTKDMLASRAPWSAAPHTPRGKAARTGRPSSLPLQHPSRSRVLYGETHVLSVPENVNIILRVYRTYPHEPLAVHGKKHVLAHSENMKNLAHPRAALGPASVRRVPLDPTRWCYIPGLPHLRELADAVSLNKT